MAPGSRLQELTAKYMQNPRRFFVPLANEYRLSGDLDRAIALCREHLPSQPGHMSGHIVLGRAYYEKGDLTAARDVFLTSVSLDDENLIALRHLGDIARSGSDAVEARSWYARVLDADPENREIEQLLRSLDAPTESVGEAPAEEAPAGIVAADGAFVGGDAVLADASPADAPSVETAASPMLGELSSALADPTPPGLRAILGEDAGPAFDSHLVRVPDEPLPAVTRPLETFDLSTLGAEVVAEIDGDFVPEAPAADIAAPRPLAEEFGIAVEEGGFAFSDLDELVDPSAATMAAADTLPPVEDADFTTGVETPTAVPAHSPEDELLSRPVFGALASFASWRTAQERETPASVAPQADASIPCQRREMAAIDDDVDLLFHPGEPDAASTAPEFVTETMAALYAQQGFTRQALDIYRTLLDRSPGDVALTLKVMQLQAALDTPTVDASLEADADKALEFGELEDAVSGQDAGLSILETMYDASPVPTDAVIDDPFGSSWTPAADAELTGGDDWFSDVDADPVGGFAESSTEIFGLSIDGIVDELGAGAEVAHDRRQPAIALSTVLGGTAVAAADETAADMLASLASQMVGRLPKEPPTLPVPDVLELPSAVAGDEATGASPAPLLSFDRFFSGSGSPPRPRVDTPVQQLGLAATETPVAPRTPAPSLSPTFGGVPVIPPPTPSEAPTWAGFDQFMPPSAPAAPAHAAPADPTPTPSLTPSGAFWTPAYVPAVPETPTAPTPVEPVRPVTPPTAWAVPASEPASPAPAESPAPEEPRRTPPSDFHRWLEGLA